MPQASRNPSLASSAALLLALFVATPALLDGQQVASAPSRPRTDGGVLAGVSFGGFTWSYPGGGATSPGVLPASPYLGGFLRHSLNRTVHAEVEGVIERLTDNGDGAALFLAHAPLLLEFVPLPTSAARRFVRPSFHVGLSPGLRMFATGGSSTLSSLRVVELAGVVGAGAEAHFGNGGWVQLFGRVQLGLSDMSPGIAKTTSHVYALVLKLHPEHRD